MAAMNRPLRYGRVAMTFHWAIAFLVFTNIALGITFVQFLDRLDPIRPGVVQAHESIGIAVLVLSLLRLLWRFLNPAPDLPKDFSRLKRILARGTHAALYALMILVPYFGWQLASIPEGPLVLFGGVHWPKIWYFAGLGPEAQSRWIGIVAPSHIALAFLLLALASGHLCAALFYHFAIRRDQILQRMLPGAEVSLEAAKKG